MTIFCRIYFEFGHGFISLTALVNYLTVIISASLSSFSAISISQSFNAVYDRRVDRFFRLFVDDMMFNDTFDMYMR